MKATKAKRQGFRQGSGFIWDEKATKAALCLASGGTQDEAGKAAGVSARSIRNWLSDTTFAEEVDRLTLMVGISSRAERLRLAMRVVKLKAGGRQIQTEKDLLDWLKFAQSETDGVKLDLTKLAALFEDEAPVAD